MNIKLHIGNAGGQLDNLVNDIRKAFDLTKKEATKRLVADGIDIFVFRSDFGSIPELGFGGFTSSAHTVFCYIGENTKIIDPHRLAGIMLHEFHHAQRNKSVGYGDTLGEAMVSEGLATLLEYEYLGIIPIYAKVVLNNKIRLSSKKELNNENYDHDAWFYGTGNQQRWAGYTIGYKICKEYSKEKHLSASQLVDTPADDILTYWYESHD